MIVHLRDEPVTAAMLPESVLHYVLRTRESVILDDAAAQSAFAEDPYIRQRQARSILCLPLINQAKLIGVLYLENNLAPQRLRAGPDRGAEAARLAGGDLRWRTPACTAIWRNAKRRSGAWSTPTSSASSSGISTVGFLRPTTRFSASWDTSVKISSRAACAGRI